MQANLAELSNVFETGLLSSEPLLLLTMGGLLLMLSFRLRGRRDQASASQPAVSRTLASSAVVSAPQPR